MEVVNAADGWSVAEAAVWPPAVVVAQERCQGAVSGVVVGPDLGFGAFAVEGLDEAFDLAVPARCPGWREDVTRSVAGECVGERARAAVDQRVVGHHRLRRAAAELA